MKQNHDILMVEDDDVDAMTARRALKQVGAPNPLHRVHDGVEAIEFLRDPKNPRPGLILLDLNMPRMGGLEFLTLAKEDPQLRSIPVIVLTTSSEQGDRCAAFNQSVAGYMIKPVDYEQFVTIMRVIKEYWAASEASS